MPLKLAVFDFDQTLSACHVYYALAGGEGGIRVPPPYARTEAGQLARLAELDALPEFGAKGGFALAAFNGPERVAQLRAVLDELHGAGVECIVCSRGLVGPLRRCLDQVGLLGHFSRIFANIGGTNPTDYDRRVSPSALGPDARFLGSPANSGWGTKRRLIARCLRERGLHSAEAVFVDDTPAEIEGAQGACATIQVQQPPGGMGPREFGLLRHLLRGGAGGGKPAEGSRQAAQRPHQVPPQPQSFPQVAAHGHANGRPGWRRLEETPQGEAGAPEAAASARAWAGQPPRGFSEGAQDTEPRDWRHLQWEQDGGLEHRLPEPPPPGRVPVWRGSGGLQRTGSAPPASRADREGGTPPPPPPPPRRIPTSDAEGGGACVATPPPAARPRPVEARTAERRGSAAGALKASPGSARSAAAREQRHRGLRGLGRGSPWTPYEGTVPEEGQQTPVCCWLQAGTGTMAPTPRAREEGRELPSWPLRCSQQ